MCGAQCIRDTARARGREGCGASEGREMGGARERDLLTSLHNEFELVDAVGRGFACVMKLFRAAEQRGPPSAPVDRSLIGFGLTTEGKTETETET